MACVLPDGDTADLDALFVDPPAIGSGAGRALFEAAVVLARRQGARRMTILADPNAAAFYERMGARYLRHAPSDAIPGRTCRSMSTTFSRGPFHDHARSFIGTSRHHRLHRARHDGPADGGAARRGGLQASPLRPLAEGGVGFHRRPSLGAGDRLAQGRGARRRCRDHHAARRQDRAAGADRRPRPRARGHGGGRDRHRHELVQSRRHPEARARSRGAAAWPCSTRRCRAA